MDTPVNTNAQVLQNTQVNCTTANANNGIFNKKNQKSNLKNKKHFYKKCRKFNQQIGCHCVCRAASAAIVAAILMSYGVNVQKAQKQ